MNSPLLCLRLALLTAIIALATPARAQYCDFYGVHCPWEVGTSGAINPDGYEVSLAGAYFPREFFGVKASVGVASEFGDISLEWDEEYGLDLYDNDPDYETVSRFKFTTSLVFRSPAIYYNPNTDFGVHLFGEPGFVLSPGASHSRSPRWYAWDFKGGANFQFGPLLLFAGYQVSSFQLYSGISTSPHDPFTHSLFTGLAFKM